MFKSIDFIINVQNFTFRRLTPTGLDRDLNAAKNIKKKALVDALGTRMRIKSSPMTKLHDSSVIAKEEQNIVLGSHEAQTIALSLLE
jgi:hypothetical protein